MTRISWVGLLYLFLFSLACGGTSNDLTPSSEDLRNTSNSGVGSNIGQQAPLQSETNSFGTSIDLPTRLKSHDAMLLYFTMWCPVCDAHSQHIRSQILTKFANVDVHLVDFVSSNQTSSWGAQMSGGYSDFSTLIDPNNSLEQRFGGAMGKTIIVHSNGNIIFNEGYKDGTRVLEALNSLP